GADQGRVALPDPPPLAAARGTAQSGRVRHGREEIQGSGRGGRRRSDQYSLKRNGVPDHHTSWPSPRSRPPSRKTFRADISATTSASFPDVRSTSSSSAAE